MQERVAEVPEGEAHRVYLDLCRYIQEQVENIAICFDNWRRSQALLLLLCWRTRNLITDEEFAGFSAETREAIESLLTLRDEGAE